MVLADDVDSHLLPEVGASSSGDVLLWVHDLLVLSVPQVTRITELVTQ